MKKYEVIYADCPWMNTRRGGNGAADKHYKQMSDDELSDFGDFVQGISERDAVLFMWATSPILPKAVLLMERWGFDYRTIGFVWVKTTKNGTDAFGCGSYTRQNAELCLIGVRGKGLRRLSASVRQIVLAPRGAHSEKPEAVRTRIESLYGNVPRIELFARKVVTGWDAYGDEVCEKDEIMMTWKDTGRVRTVTVRGKV